MAFSPSEKITLARSGERSFELVDADGARDLFAIPEHGRDIARLVGKADANGNRLDIGYTPRQLPELVKDDAGRVFTLAYEDVRGQSRLRSIIVRHQEEAGANALLVTYQFSMHD